MDQPDILSHSPVQFLFLAKFYPEVIIYLSIYLTNHLCNYSLGIDSFDCLKKKLDATPGKYISIYYISLYIFYIKTTILFYDKNFMINQNIKTTQPNLKKKNYFLLDYHWQNFKNNYVKHKTN